MPAHWWGRKARELLLPQPLRTKRIHFELQPVFVLLTDFQITQRPIGLVHHSFGRGRTRQDRIVGQRNTTPQKGNDEYREAKNVEFFHRELSTLPLQMGSLQRILKSLPRPTIDCIQSLSATLFIRLS